MLHRLAALRSRAFTAAWAAPWQAGAGRPAERSFAALPLEVARDEAAFFGDLPQPRFRGLTLDAAGTLLSPSEPAAEVLACLQLLNRDANDDVLTLWA
jgi:hypothetical protein